MTTLHVYDRPMCCATGVCGPTINAVLPRFAADLEWLKSQGVTVERFNLAQQPAAFSAQAEVKAALADGIACLPLLVVADRIVSRGIYPARHMLAAWTGVAVAAAQPTSACCSAPGCCGKEAPHGTPA